MVPVELGTWHMNFPLQRILLLSFFRAATSKITQSLLCTHRHCYNTAAEQRQALIYAVETEWVEMSQDLTACQF